MIQELTKRKLTKDEIEVRVAQVGEGWISLLLYKNARTDMDILDECIGPDNWQREHKELKGTIYCGISIYDPKKAQWITKWDCGAESFSDKEKGESSDSFKRSATCWSIGRELYSSPAIYIREFDKDTKETNYIVDTKNGKKVIKTKFKVHSIEINDNKEITGLTIVNDKGKKVFIFKR